jgi:hypothetical protein
MEILVILFCFSLVVVAVHLVWRGFRNDGRFGPRLCGAALFDNLVCAAEQRRWKNQAKSLGGAQVDDQFNFYCFLDRQAARLGAKPSHSTDYGFLLHDEQARPIHIEEILGILHCCSHLRGL